MWANRVGVDARGTCARRILGKRGVSIERSRTSCHCSGRNYIEAAHLERASNKE